MEKTTITCLLKTIGSCTGCGILAILSEKLTKDGKQRDIISSRQIGERIQEEYCPPEITMQTDKALMNEKQSIW